jgi:iodotyrosine deiodinase
MDSAPHIPLNFQRLAPSEMLERAQAFEQAMAPRRSVRQFSPDPLPEGVLEACIRCAGSAPSGAHQQPWTFALVRDPELKRKIRAAAEEEERINYSGRMNDEWLEALEPLQTDANKEFLETAPALIVLFRQAHGVEPDGGKRQFYYTHESIGIALGFLLAALHQSGIATLTHTPSPLKFLEPLLDRPKNERAYMLLPVGYPAEDCEVPDLQRKSLDEICIERG